MRLTILAVLFATLAAACSGRGQKNAKGVPLEVIDALALDAASSSFEVENATFGGAWGLMLVYVTVTDADNSTTAVAMSCTASVDNNAADYALQDCTVAAGVATCVDLSWMHNPAAASSPKRWVNRVDIEGFEDVECTFTDTGGAAADLLDVTIDFAVKG